MGSIYAPQHYKDDSLIMLERIKEDVESLIDREQTLVIFLKLITPQCVHQLSIDFEEPFDSVLERVYEMLCI